jgi:hypothetical protein
LNIAWRAALVRCSSAEGTCGSGRLDLSLIMLPPNALPFGIDSSFRRGVSVSGRERPVRQRAVGFL